MVTAETAMAIPALVIVLGGLIAVIAAVLAQLQCVAAAREGARAAARGESSSVVHEMTLRAAPDGARLSVAQSGKTVTVTVTAEVRPLGLRAASITVSGSATSAQEPTGDDVSAAPAAYSGSPLAGLMVLGLFGRRLTYLRRRQRHQRGPGSQRRQRGPGRLNPSDRGSGTVFVVGCIAVLGAIAAAAAFVGKAYVAHTRAEAAADLAALAAAQALIDASGDPCAQAAAIAASNHAQVSGCAIDGETVLVTTAVTVDLGVFGTGTATGKARAGPVDVPPAKP